MKGHKRNKFMFMNVQANTGGVPFAGVPLFSNPITPTQPNPMSGSSPNGVPTPALKPTDSKIYPGQPSSSSGDPITDPAATPKEGSSPLDKFAKLFDNSPKVDDKGNPITPPKTILDAGVSEYSKAAEKLNFAEGIKAETIEAISKGGDDAVTALGEILNTFGRNVYAQAMASATKVTKSGLDLSRSSVESRIQDLIKLNAAKGGIKGNTAVLNHPSVAPLVDAIQQQLLKQNPNMNADDLARTTMEYFGHLSEVSANKASDSPTAKDGNKDDFDFLAFLTTE